MKRTVILGGTAVILMAVGAFLAKRALRPAQDTGDPGPFPAARDTGADTAPPLAAFAGAAACASCHASEYAIWRTSTHGRAGGTPVTATIVARFDGKPMRFRDATVTPSRSGDALTFTVALDGRPPERFEVAGIIGAAHVRGGGTQGFVSRAADGTLRFLPFDFAKRENTWFCNTLARGGTGWIPITPDLPIAACGDWPPSRILGEEPRIANCSGCHGSRIEVRFDPGARRYVTTVGTFAIDCESCHGPGRAHIERARAGAADGGGMRMLATATKQQSVQTCLSCHAVKDALRTGYRPGASLARFYSIALAQLGDSPLFPDGRVRTFAYQEGHLSSDCFVSGGMTCTDCHDPHSQGYRDVQGTPLPSPFDDRQCTSCHVSKGVAGRAHTKHAPGTPGSACVSCHMPYLQHPEIGSRIRFARADHTIPIPRPSVDAGQGLVTACASCHSDRPIATLDADVARLWGTLKPRPAVVDAVARAASFDNRVHAARALLVAGPAPLSGRIAALGAFLERQLSPDMGPLEPEVTGRLLSLADDPDVDIRAIALASLHYARGRDARVRAELARRLSTAGASDAMLRRRWTLVLGFLADRARAANDNARAALLYRKALEVEPASARLLLSLGVALAADGNAPAAIEAYRRSIDSDRTQPLAFINLGLVLEQGDMQAAAAAYRRAIEINPFEAVAYFNLGNVFLRTGQAQDAASLYERAIVLDPSLANAHFYLARVYASAGQLDRALDEVDDGLRFQPTDPDALELRAEIVGARSR